MLASDLVAYRGPVRQVGVRGRSADELSQVMERALKEDGLRRLRRPRVPIGPLGFFLTHVVASAAGVDRRRAQLHR